MAREAFAGLARRIAEIEGRPTPATAVPAARGEESGLGHRRDATRLPLGVAAIDAALGGGLRRDALHEVRAATTRDSASASGFALALLVRLAGADDRPSLLVLEADATREGGLPYGPGLGQLGLDPARLVIVAARRPEEALWVFEEGLRCTGLAAVLCELRGHPPALDLTASRRLSLRAREGGVTALLLRQAGAAEPGAALTRWRVAPRPAGTLDGFAQGIGRPAWRLDLERNRAGRTGHFDLEWDHDACRFAPLGPALPVAGAAALIDRPHPADAGRPVVALRRAG